MSKFVIESKSQIQKAMQALYESLKYWFWKEDTGLVTTDEIVEPFEDYIYVCKCKHFKKQEDIPELLLILKGIPNDN